MRASAAASGAAGSAATGAAAVFTVTAAAAEEAADAEAADAAAWAARAASAAARSLADFSAHSRRAVALESRDFALGPGGPVLQPELQRVGRRNACHAGASAHPRYSLQEPALGPPPP